VLCLAYSSGILLLKSDHPVRRHRLIGSAQLREAYATALQRAANGEEVAAAEVRRVVECCLGEGIDPAGLVRLHIDLSVEQTPGAAIRLDAYVSGMTLVERVMRELQTDLRPDVHGLRNGLQMLTGSLALLERDLRDHGGARALSLLGRIKSSAWSLAERIEALADRRGEAARQREAARATPRTGQPSEGRSREIGTDRGPGYAR
ncbi:MAG: hypothetical protein M3281_07090, partial [Chloroflexota bacterium]|nr:hypothetical protein [Chloroflexota bacterium]